MPTDIPRTRVLGVVPVLVVHSLLKSAEFYRRALGFSHPQLLGTPPTIALLERDGQRLQLELADCEVTISPSGTSDVVLMVENVASERERLRSQGISVDWPVELVDGIRKRSFVDVIDPDGYRVSIEQQTWLTDLSHTQ